MKNINGFTLMEILVAVAILALLGLATSGVVYNTFNAKTSAERDIEAIDVGRGALRIMSKDISLAFSRPKYSSTTKTASQTNYNDSETQTKENMPTALVGKNIEPFDELQFTTLSHMRLYVDSHESEQAEVGFFVEADSTNQENMILYRRESKRINDDPLEGGRVDKIAENVIYLNFRYWDCLKEKFVDEWDSVESIDTRGKFPEAIEIRLGLDDFKGGVKNFESVVLIKMPNNIERKKRLQAVANTGPTGGTPLDLTQGKKCEECKKNNTTCPDYCPSTGNEEVSLLSKAPEGSCSQ